MKWGHQHLMQPPLHCLVTVSGSAKSRLLIVFSLQTIVSSSGASRILTLALRPFSTPPREQLTGSLKQSQGVGVAMLCLLHTGKLRHREMESPLQGARCHAGFWGCSGGTGQTLFSSPARPPGGLAAGTELTRFVPEWWLMEVVAG